MRAAPDLGSQVDTRIISGIANPGEKLVVLLDMDRLLTEADLTPPAGVNQDEKTKRGSDL